LERKAGSIAAVMTVGAKVQPTSLTYLP